MDADLVYDDETSAATIRVEQASREQVEERLLHELMHLKLAAWNPPAQPSAEEETVDTIASALYRSGNVK